MNDRVWQLLIAVAPSLAIAWFAFRGTRSTNQAGDAASTREWADRLMNQMGGEIQRLSDQVERLRSANETLRRQLSEEREDRAREREANAQLRRESAEARAEINRLRERVATLEARDTIDGLDPHRDRDL